MAFSESEKYKIIRFLGWNGGTLTPTNIYYSKNIVDKLTNIPEGAVVEAKEILAKIILLDGKQMGSTAQAGVKRVDDIEFFENGGSTAVLAREKRRLCKELAELLGIPYCGGGSIMGNVSV